MNGGNVGQASSLRVSGRRGGEYAMLSEGRRWGTGVCSGLLICLSSKLILRPTRTTSTPAHAKQGPVATFDSSSSSSSSMIRDMTGGTAKKRIQAALFSDCQTAACNEDLLPLGSSRVSVSRAKSRRCTFGRLAKCLWNSFIRVSLS